MTLDSSDLTDELFCKGTGHGKVNPRGDESEGKDEREENNGIGVEGEVIMIPIYPASVVTLVGSIALYRQSRDGDESEKGKDQLQRSGISR